MPTLVPARFLVRFCLRCPFVKTMPLSGKSGPLLDLPESARLVAAPELDGAVEFADVRLGWNDLGLGVSVVVTGKKNPPVGDRDRPRSSDGLTLWLDTRDARTSHRATRFCHQFHLLASGGGPDKDQPTLHQTKINRALQDAPLCDTSAVPFRGSRTKSGYRLEAFLPASVLSGFDPDQHPRLGVFYAVRDQDLGDQTLTLPGEFPFSDDPSLWPTLELSK
jgi:hypothetical protein